MLSPEAGLSPVHYAAKTKDHVSSMFREITMFAVFGFQGDIYSGKRKMFPLRGCLTCPQCQCQLGDDPVRHAWASFVVGCPQCRGPK